MKLAEALILRADLQKHIAQLKERLHSNAKVQENDTPAEDPQALLNELSGDISQLEELIRRINHSNCTTMGADGLSLTDKLAHRDALALYLSTLREFCSEASRKVDRYANTEIRIFSTVSVSELQKQIDAMSRELRLLDTEIQGLNWTCDLL